MNTLLFRFNMSENGVKLIEICDEKENILKEKKKSDSKTNNNNNNNNNNIIPNDKKETLAKTGKCKLSRNIFWC